MVRAGAPVCVCTALVPGTCTCTCAPCMCTAGLRDVRRNEVWPCAAAVCDYVASRGTSHCKRSGSGA
eukprot:321764-Chlamydomonas_euryale.AAC.5